mmetsp:Transcript_41629/g.120575  ORF Transcript_41629/g.120575 Transcript_41629/m.120575 type:complete len:203 (-) Transcript_41629:762-1370(-)
MAQKPARWSISQKPAVRSISPVGGASGMCISMCRASAMPKNSSGKAPATTAAAEPTINRIWLYRKNFPRRRTRRRAPSRVGSTAHMKMVLCVCLMTSGRRSRHTPLSASRAQISTHGGSTNGCLGATSASPGAAAPAPAASAPAASGASPSSISASSSPGPPSSPSTSALASASAASSSSFRFLPLPLPFPFLPFPLPLSLP